MEKIGSFPFGEPLAKVSQTDRQPKKVFVLGVYASAVHTRWVDQNRHAKVRALAVASEPYIFWRGDGVYEILARIQIPASLGNLLPAEATFNGPSGIALDELILHPMGISRKEAWLCDLIPYSCLNPAQKRALEREYLPLMDEYDLPLPTVPELPNRFTDEVRREEILSEFRESNADMLILLGDQPIRWFLEFYDRKWHRLTDFLEEKPYGRLQKMELGGKPINLLPIAHPRQIAKLGRTSQRWYELHQRWIRSDAKDIL